MDKQNEHLENLTEIRSMMERSSRFISLSGLSGVFAGVFALAGAYMAYRHFTGSETFRAYDASFNFDQYIYYIADALLVLAASLMAGILLTIRKAKSKGLKIWDHTAKRLFINLFLPLAAGGSFCLILLYHRLFGLIPSVTLLFYGLALINASKYTLHDIRYLGVCQIVLGLLAAVFLGYGLIFWAVGFGILHIVYGAVMYFKYEK